MGQSVAVHGGNSGRQGGGGGIVLEGDIEGADLARNERRQRDEAQGAEGGEGETLAEVHWSNICRIQKLGGEVWE